MHESSHAKLRALLTNLHSIAVGGGGEAARDSCAGAGAAAAAGEGRQRGDLDDGATDHGDDGEGEEDKMHIH